MRERSPACRGWHSRIAQWTAPVRAAGHGRNGDGGCPTRRGTRLQSRRSGTLCRLPMIAEALARGPDDVLIDNRSSVDLTGEAAFNSHPGTTFAASTASLEHPHSLGIIRRLICLSVRASHSSASDGRSREPSHVRQCRFTAYAAGRTCRHRGWCPPDRVATCYVDAEPRRPRRYCDLDHLQDHNDGLRHRILRFDGRTGRPLPLCRRAHSAWWRCVQP